MGYCIYLAYSCFYDGLFIPGRNNCTQLLHCKFILNKLLAQAGATQEQIVNQTSGKKVKKIKLMRCTCSPRPQLLRACNRKERQLRKQQHWLLIKIQDQKFQVEVISDHLIFMDLVKCWWREMDPKKQDPFIKNISLDQFIKNFGNERSQEFKQ